MNILNVVKSFASQAADVALVAVDEAKVVVNTAVDSAKNSYQTGGIQAALNQAGANFADVSAQVVGIATKAVDATKAVYNEHGGVKGMLDQANAEFGQAVNQITETVTAKASELKDVADTSIDKATTELTEVATEIKSAATEAVNKVKRTTK